MESFNIHELSGPVRNIVRPLIARGLEDSFQSQGIDGFYKFTREYLETANARPEFVKESDPKFSEWRRRLNTERGIMISNHPGVLDAPLLVQALQRSDLKIVVNEKLYNETKGMAVNSLFISALSNSVAEVKGVLSEMNKHIKDGGLLWIFPTGMVTDGDIDAEFASGLRHLISNLDDADMVYAFHIDRESLGTAGNTLKINSGVIADFLDLPYLNPNSHRDMTIVKIDESCTSAGEWKEAMSQVTKSDKNRALTDHYLTMFGITEDELERRQKDS